MITEHDRAICERVVLRFRGEGGFGQDIDNSELRVKFQRPPKILSDNRRGQWDEADERGKEQNAVFATSGSRDISLSWDYVVENYAEGEWSIIDIKTEINKLRGYFARIKNNASDRETLSVLFQYDIVAGVGPWTCRIRSVDIKHSDTLVGPPELIFPLKTDVSLDMAVWTTGRINDGEVLQDIQELKDEPNAADLWY